LPVSSGRGTDHVEYCEHLGREWSASGELSPPPLLTGNDLLEMGVEQGPIYKRLLDAVREAQLDGSLTGPAQARELVERLLASNREGE